MEQTEAQKRELQRRTNYHHNRGALITGITLILSTPLDERKLAAITGSAEEILQLDKEDAIESLKYGLGQ